MRVRFNVILFFIIICMALLFVCSGCTKQESNQAEDCLSSESLEEELTDSKNDKLDEEQMLDIESSMSETSGQTENIEESKIEEEVLDSSENESVSEEDSESPTNNEMSNTVVEEASSSETSETIYEEPSKVETENEAENEVVLEETSEVVPNEEVSTVNLGEFRLTAYCNCSACCGKWAGGATASGVMPVANHTIAVDTSVIPFGTEVIINGITYVAEDTGSAIYGNRIDIYFDTHQEAMSFGVQYAEVHRVS